MNVFVFKLFFLLVLWEFHTSCLYLFPFLIHPTLCPYLWDGSSAICALCVLLFSWVCSHSLECGGTARDHTPKWKPIPIPQQPPALNSSSVSGRNSCVTPSPWWNLDWHSVVQATKALMCTPEVYSFIKQKHFLILGEKEWFMDRISLLFV